MPTRHDSHEVIHDIIRLVPADCDFDEALRNVSGEYRWEAIAEAAKRLFGLPDRIMVFDGATADLREALGGRRGLSPFFFVFDMMFCEYPECTLCFMSGTNN